MATCSPPPCPLFSHFPCTPQRFPEQLTLLLPISVLCSWRSFIRARHHAIDLSLSLASPNASQSNQRYYCQLVCHLLGDHLFELVITQRSLLSQGEHCLRRGWCCRLFGSLSYTYLGGSPPITQLHCLRSVPPVSTA